jgi:DNA-binding beta-propeller fold protein YncE/mono/diheme cytochrome c family protein
VSTRLATIGVALALLSCASESPIVETSSSSTMLLDPSGGRLWVLSPDDDAMVTIATGDGTEIERTSIPGEPQEMVAAGAARVITLGRMGAVALVDAAGSTTTLPVPCGWTRSLASLGARTFVTCPDDDRVIEIDAAAGRVVWTIEVEGEPTAIAIAGERLAVTTARTHLLVTFDLSTATPMPLASTPLPVDAMRSASQPASIAGDRHGGFAVVYQSVANDGPRDLPAADGGYGALVDGSPRIEPRVLGPCGDRYARFDGGELAMSGPSAIAIGGGLVWIANLYTDNVLVARCSTHDASFSGGSLEVLATFRVGRAPRAIVLSPDGQRAFVDLGFDWAVAQLDAPASRAPMRLDATWTRRRTRAAAHLSEAALRGRSAFFDAVDTHLTPSGVVSCGTCHPRGGEDGLSWFLHTTNVPAKLRRTPPAWGARAALLPYHWDGQFTDAALLSQTTTHELMNGDGLLVGFDDIATYLSELAPPPARAADDPAAVARGAALFVGSGCDTCHAGAYFADGMPHAVIPTSTDADAMLASADTPSLIAVRGRAPFFHDGSAPTLRETIAVEGDTHGMTSALTPSERDDLVAYMESL